jgi:16S rRNA (guanine966-N2)-methyltransferase
VTRPVGGLRVVAGRFGGRRLRAPAGAQTRPTAGRVREALYNMLAERVGSRVLDLYAGSGALGIEALSRGADAAVFVDRDQRSCLEAKRNLATLGLSRAEARVVRRDVASFLRDPPPVEAPFDLVLVDPPYGASDAEVTRLLGALGEPGWLAAGAAVVVERPRAGGMPPLPAGWDVAWQRVYGDTLVALATAPSGN